MTKPIFASKWFKDVPAAELRQEIQNLYREIASLKSETAEDLESLEGTVAEQGADITALEEGKVDRAGDTMTGPLSVQGKVILHDDTESSVHLHSGGEEVGGLYASSVGNIILSSDKSGGNIYFRPNGRSSQQREMFWGSASDAPQFRDAGGTVQNVLHEGIYPVTIDSWTPTLGGSTSDPTVSYTAQVGYYVRLGPRLVWVFLRIQTTSRTGGSGNIVIRGFPFSITNANNSTGGILAVEASQIDHGTGTRTLSGRALSGTSGFSLVTSPSNGGFGFVPITGWNSNSSVAMSGIVLIAPGQ